MSRICKGLVLAALVPLLLPLYACDCPGACDGACSCHPAPKKDCCSESPSKEESCTCAELQAGDAILSAMPVSPEHGALHAVKTPSPQVPASDTTRAPIEEDRPPRNRPPLYLLHCSLLR